MQSLIISQTGNMFTVIVLCVVGVSLAQAKTTTTHRPHHTNEPNEHDNYRFAYEPHTHTMVLIDNHVCYEYNLSDSERTAVHTDIGIRTLELKMLGMVFGSNYRAVTLENMATQVQHLCGKTTTAFYSLNM